MMVRVLLGHGFTAETLGKPAAIWRRMARHGLRLFALLAALFLASSAGWAEDPAPPGADELTARMLSLVNTERANAGQPALAFERRLNAAACRHAMDLARGGPLSHRGSDGSDLSERLTRSGYPFALAAENLAAGVATPDETVWLWSGSPGHRRNMLTAEFRDAGIAHRVGAGGAVWVLVFGTQQSVSGASEAKEGPQNAARDKTQMGDVRDDKALTCY